MSETSSRILFVGPTRIGLSPDAERALEFFDVRPPIQRGDLLTLPHGDTGTLVIVYGLFQDCLAVSHAEIRDASNQGWIVWGLSSMGAIRAYEMRTMGI